MDNLYLLALAERMGVEVDELSPACGDGDRNAAYQTASQSHAVKEYENFMRQQGLSPVTMRRVKR